MANQLRAAPQEHITFGETKPRSVPPRTPPFPFYAGGTSLRPQLLPLCKNSWSPNWSKQAVCTTEAPLQLTKTEANRLGSPAKLQVIPPPFSLSLPLPPNTPSGPTPLDPRSVSFSPFVQGGLSSSVLLLVSRRLWGADGDFSRPSTLRPFSPWFGTIRRESPAFPGQIGWESLSLPLLPYSRNRALGLGPT